LTKIKRNKTQASYEKSNCYFFQRSYGRNACFRRNARSDSNIDYLKAGDSIDEFLEGFPTVSREQVVAFLEEAEKRMEKKAA
jgi:uncharacterized protein (DUF433 family)